MKTEHKCAYTCSLSSFSLLISRSFICNCSCCCWMSSKCSNKSCRNWVNSPTTSILWLLPSQAISGSDGLTNGTSVLGCSCSFCVSLLLLPFFRAIEDFDRKTRVTCRSDRELAEPVANLFPTKGASVFVWFWSMFPVQGKSVVITIWQTLVHVLSNTALKLFRFIRVKNSHHGTLAVHVTKTWRTTRMRGSRCSRKLQMSFPVWSLKNVLFSKTIQYNSLEKKYKLFRNLHCPNTFRIQQADENCLRQNDAISGSDGMERRDRLPSWERCVLVYFRLKLDRVLFT